MTGALLSSDCHVEVDSGSPSEERILSMVAEREVLREEGRFEEAEEVHDQLDNMGVKILAKERSGNMTTPKAADKTVIPKLKNLAVVDASVCNDSKTDVVKRSNEEGNWSDGSEDSSQEKEVQFFVMFTPRPEAQAQRASQGQGLSSVCEYSEDEIRQLVAQRERARASRLTQPSHLVTAGVP